jgi:hypothetical protein
MKYLLFLTILLLQFSAQGQRYINLEIVDGVATFYGEAETPDKPVGDLHELTMAWLEKTFQSEDAVTLNTKTKITAMYDVDYTVEKNQATFKHNLQIDLTEGKVLFTITDKSMYLVHANGDWKKHLTELRVKFEKGCNELLWSYTKYVNEHEVNE